MRKLIVSTAVAATLIAGGGTAFAMAMHEQSVVEQLRRDHVKQLTERQKKYDNLRKTSSDAIMKYQQESWDKTEQLRERAEELREKNNQISEKDQQLQSQSAKIAQLQKQIDESPRKQIEKVSETKQVEKPKQESKSDSSWSTFEATAYSTHENGDPYAGVQWGNKTATGTTVQQGRTIAVDRNVIPLGSRVQVEFPEPYSYLNGTYTAEDTGNGINGNEIDVFINDYAVCLDFGRRPVKVKVI